MSIHELPQFYDLKRFPFMKPQGPHMPITETYVSIPPALCIRDNENALWTLGFDYDEREWRTGKWEYDVVRNGVKTGDFARTIEYRSEGLSRTVRIWGAEGWRTFNGKQFV